MCLSPADSPSDWLHPGRADQPQFRIPAQKAGRMPPDRVSKAASSSRFTNTNPRNLASDAIREAVFPRAKSRY